MGIVRFSIKNFRGVVELAAEPNGRSVTLRGRNGVGKSSAIDALWWGMGGAIDGEVVKNGADRAEVEMVFGDYLVRRQQGRGKKPTLTVKSADGKASFTSPTALLAGFVGAVERRTFSSRPAKERAEILRRLAPGLDVSDLDAERARIYEERTGVNRDAKTLRAQADGVAVPEAPAEVGEEREVADVVDVAAIAAKKGEVERVRAENAAARERVKRYQRENAERAADIEQRRATIERLRVELNELEREHRTAVGETEIAAGRASQLVDPDTAAIDAEIAAAKEQNAAARREAQEHNRAVRAAQQRVDAVARALAERHRLDDAAAAKEQASAALTARIDAIDAEKAARTAAAKLPIQGLALAGDVVTFDNGTHGPVEIEALNSAARIRLDVAIAAALGHRLIAVRDASLLDPDGRAEIERFAAERGVQLLAEVVTPGEPLSAVIEEGEAADSAQPAAPAQPALPIAIDDEI